MKISFVDVCGCMCMYDVCGWMYCGLIDGYGRMSLSYVVAERSVASFVFGIPDVLVNPRPAGPLDFPPPAGGGGLENPPPLSRLLGHVATRGKRHSKERQKS